MADEKDGPPQEKPAFWKRGLSAVGIEVVTTKDEAGAQATAAPQAPTAPKAVVVGGADKQAGPSAGVTRPRPGGQVSVDDIDPGIRSKIEGVVAQAAMPAYSVFEKTEAGMRSIIPDERTRMAATLSALSAQNIVSSAIITDLDECLAALDKRQAEAERSAQAAIDKRVGEKERRIADCEAEIKAKHAEIATLQSQIDKLEDESEDCRTAVNSARSEIEELSRKFSEAIGAFRALYQSKKQRLQSLMNKEGGST